VSTHLLWKYVHVLLFAYWLGADLGVFFASRYVARRDLALGERLRFLDLLLKIDLAPRTALILMIPVGLVLATNLGLVSLPAHWQPLVWCAALLWLAMAWYLALRGRTPLAARLQVLDRIVRLTVATVFAGLGLLTLATGGPLGAPWLGAKFIAFGGAVLLGVLLRGVIRQWIVGFGELRDPALVERGNARIEAAHARAARLALLLWVGVAAAAFFGVVKPTFD